MLIELNSKYCEWLSLRWNIALEKKGPNAVGNVDYSNCRNTSDVYIIILLSTRIRHCIAVEIAAYSYSFLKVKMCMVYFTPTIHDISHFLKQFVH